jgi:hypothetical protein
LHKKTIKGKSYFYTNYRDENGKTRTKYLGRSPKSAKKREMEFKDFPEPPQLTRMLALFIVGVFILVSGGMFTGYFFYAPSEIVTFEVNETWNLSDTFVRISMDNFTEDFLASKHILNGSILVNISTFSLPFPGEGYVDLIVGGDVVESEAFAVSEETVEENISPPSKKNPLRR